MIRARVSRTATLLALSTSAPVAAADAETELRINPSPACAPSSSRILDELKEQGIDHSASPWSASLTFVEDARATRLELELSLGHSEGSHKSVVAPSCEEAVQAAVVVLALALSEPRTAAETETTAAATKTAATTAAATTAAKDAPQDSESLPREEVVTDPAPATSNESYLRLQPEVPTSRDSVESNEEAPETDDGSWRWGFFSGVDSGSTEATAFTVGSAVSRRLGTGWLRGSVSWVQPFANETEEALPGTLLLTTPAVDPSGAQGAVLGNTDYCYGLDTRGRLSACGGLELALRNYMAEPPSADPSFNGGRQSIWRAGFGPRLGALLSTGRGRFRPDLLVSASFPVLGDQALSHVVFGASLGMSWGL